MAISWGSWASGRDSVRFRLGIDLSVSGTTITAKYYLGINYAGVSDSQTLTLTGAVTGSVSFTASSSSNDTVQLITTKTKTGSRGTKYTFGSKLSGVYNGAAPTVSASITVPGLVPSKPVTPTIGSLTSSSLVASVSAIPATNGGGSISDAMWAVQARDGTYIDLEEYSAAKSKKFTGLDANTEYRARVTFINSVGASAWSDYSGYSRTLPLAPSTPGKPHVARVSDVQHTVTGTVVASTARPVTRIELQQSVWDGAAWGAWATVSAASGSWTADTARSVTVATVANAVYMWRWRVVNSAGAAEGNASITVRTTPAGPTGVAAEKGAGGEIVVTATPAHVDGQSVSYTWEDNPGGAGWVTLGTTSTPTYTHASPNNAVTHQYRVNVAWASGAAGTLTSEWSAASNVVQLLAPPNAPLDRGPTGTVDRDADIVVPFAHQTVDTTVQTAFEARYRVAGGAWVTLSGTTAKQFTIPAVGSSSLVERQIRTRGLHATFGPWSAITAVNTAAVPTVAISEPSGTIVVSRLTVAWAYYCADGSAQASWRARLLQDGDLLEALSGVGETSTAAFARPLQDDVEYRVEVEARSASGLWSTTDFTVQTTDFLLPGAPIVSVEWDRAGYAVVSVENPPADPLAVPATVDAESNTILRSVDSGLSWVTVAELVAANGSVADWTVPVAQDVTYRVQAVSALPSVAVAEAVLTVPGSLGYLSGGAGFETVAAIRVNLSGPPTYDISEGLAERILTQYEGRLLPVEHSGVARARSGKVTWAIPPDELNTVRALAYLPGPFLLRTPRGDTMFCSISSVDRSPGAGGWWQVGITVTEVEQ